MTRRRLIAAAGCAVLLAATETLAARRRKTAAAKPAPAPTYSLRDDLLAFAAEVAQRRGLEAAWIVKQLAQARKIDTVQRLMMPAPAGTAKNWGAYRDRFVEPRRVAAGAAFWQANAAWLSKAEARFGVPAQVVVAIIGVETFYGRMNGGFRVIDALATLAFDFPTGRSDRSPFFRSELEEFLVWCSRDGVDPQVPKGSFAGAMGMAQFMPGSLNRFAIDFDGDGHVDLAGSPADAVGSVANYLAQNGWQRGVATHFEVAPPADEANRRLLLEPDIKPTFSAAQFSDQGAQLPLAARNDPGPLALVMLENGGERPPTYVAGTRNFYAITRYNWSAYYAMAVIALGEALAQAMPDWQSAVGEAVAEAPPPAPAPAASAPAAPEPEPAAPAAGEPAADPPAAPEAAASAPA